jgi:hypothetical protein
VKGNKRSIARLKRTTRRQGDKKRAGDAVGVCTVTPVIFVHAATTLQGSLLQREQ